MYENDTFEFLDSLKRFGWKLGLDNIRNLLRRHGNPHEKIRAVHIAGTNGKGSTAAILESIYRVAGYRTGLFTSPHLLRVNERIKVNGQEIGDQAFRNYLARVREDVEQIGCTYFETLTALAFLYFADQEIDLGIIEVGLGGRFDATNVLSPLLTVITRIDLDHTEYLGTSLREVALEKAGIVKPGVPCLFDSHQPVVSEVISSVCRRVGAEGVPVTALCSAEIRGLSETGSTVDLILAGEDLPSLRLALPGGHQVQNLALAVTATRLLRRHDFLVDRESIYAGVRRVRWPARLQLLQTRPRVLLDVAHNASAVENVLEAIREIYDYERLVLVLGLLRDKDQEGIAERLAGHVQHAFVASPASDRALEGRVLAAALSRRGIKTTTCSTVADAGRQALTAVGRRDLVLVTGSHYVVGEFLNFYKKS